VKFGFVRCFSPHAKQSKYILVVDGERTLQQQRSPDSQMNATAMVWGASSSAPKVTEIKRCLPL
jgi:hypothetical protein